MSTCCGWVKASAFGHVFYLLGKLAPDSPLNDGTEKKTVMWGAADEVILFPWQLNPLSLFTWLMGKLDEF